MKKTKNIYDIIWQTNTDPSIYIHNKKNLFDIRGYKRTSNFDLLNAIRFYNK